jgi:hypothetical protein
LATKKSNAKKTIIKTTATLGTQTAGSDTIIWVKITPHPNASGATAPNNLCVFFKTTSSGYFCFPINNPSTPVAESAQAWIDMLVNAMLTGDTVTISSAPATQTTVGPLQNPQSISISETYVTVTAATGTGTGPGTTSVEVANDAGNFAVVAGLSTP